ncbi:TetR/AcrR family transcriptional regulator [Haliovirga abyssi]|uniref:AcrR family transcriptional regulator n=1 Tax=Haliovirga abyssi TaxID=2996794 RepID=A0AAU9DSL4_9FUSO|nr:TetR/AcrR family transcriptional regulator [Haliovirga abyssi]BDU50034.1 AcrR family transcriptional regulator [Haliovirga abyssi]
MDKKSEILQAAIKVFMRENYQNMKTAIIAKEAGVAEGTIYRYFKNKKEIFVEILNYYSKYIPEYLFENIKQKNDFETNLNILIDNYDKLSKEHKNFKKAYYKGLSEIEDERIKNILKFTLEDSFKRLENIFIWANNKKEGNFTKTSIEVITNTLWGLAEVIMKKEILGCEDVMEKDEISKMVKLIIKLK